MDNVKDFFLLDRSVRHADVPRTLYEIEKGNFLEELFVSDAKKTKYYYAVRNLPNGCAVKYYLVKAYETFDGHYWSMEFYLPKEIAEEINKIHEACFWRSLFTEDSLRHAFRNFPHIGKYLILREDNVSYYSLWDVHHFSITYDGEYLSDQKEMELVQKLYDVVTGIFRELAGFKIDVSDLVRKPNESRGMELPSWLREGINGFVRVGAKGLAAYIGQNVDFDFDIGDGGHLNVDGDFDLPSDFGNIDIDGDFDLPGDIDVDADGIQLLDADGAAGMNSDASRPDVDTDGLPFRAQTRDGLPAGANRDGYIPNGSITLQKQAGGGSSTFKLYTKGGSRYVLYFGDYIRLSGSSVRIGGITYSL